MVYGRALVIIVIFIIGFVAFKVINLTKVRTPIDLTEFKSYMEAKKYVVLKKENESGAKNTYIANKDEIKVEIVEFSTTEDAEEFFLEKKEKFVEEDTAGCTSFGWAWKNFAKYHLNKFKEYEHDREKESVLEAYKVIYRVDNVVMYSDVKINNSKIFTSNKKEVEKIFKKFGY